MGVRISGCYGVIGVCTDDEAEVAMCSTSCLGWMGQIGCWLCIVDDSWTGDCHILGYQRWE